MKKKRTKLKINFFHVFLILALPLSVQLLTGVVSKYWFPPVVRNILLPPKFESGQCISAREHWAVNPKQVLAYKDEGKSIVYLLKDVDKYEQLQKLDYAHVERVATRVPCGRMN